MRKHLTIGLGAILAVALAVPTFAQDNVTGLGSDESAAGTISIPLTSITNYKASRYRCSDPTATSTTIAARVTDCCTAGDIFRVTVFKGLNPKRFAHVANVQQNLPGAPAFPPGVASPAATIATAVNNVDVLATAGNSHPGGLPAGWTLTVTTNGGGPACTRRQNID